MATAEGLLLEQRRSEMRPRLSVRKAAHRAGMSDTRWRQIVKGFVVNGGVPSPVRAPAETVARMAAVVGVGPDELHSVGREDAATAMEDQGLIPGVAPDGPAGQLVDPMVVRVLAQLDPENRQRAADFIRGLYAAQGGPPEPHRDTA